MIEASTKSPKFKSYKVVCEDGTIHYVHGNYAAHAWAVARQLYPDKEIKGFYLLAETEVEISLDT